MKKETVSKESFWTQITQISTNPIDSQFRKLYSYRHLCFCKFAFIRVICILIAFDIAP